MRKKSLAFIIVVCVAVVATFALLEINSRQRAEQVTPKIIANMALKEIQGHYIGRYIRAIKEGTRISQTNDLEALFGIPTNLDEKIMIARLVILGENNIDYLGIVSVLHKLTLLHIEKSRSVPRINGRKNYQGTILLQVRELVEIFQKLDRQIAVNADFLASQKKDLAFFTSKSEKWKNRPRRYFNEEFNKEFFVAYPQYKEEAPGFSLTSLEGVRGNRNSEQYHAPEIANLKEILTTLPEKVSRDDYGLILGQIAQEISPKRHVDFLGKNDI